MKILLVEDEKNIANPIIRVLEKQGYVIDYAEDGEIAMNFIELNDYDLVILDLNLPEIDGLTIAKHIRDNVKKLQSSCSLHAVKSMTNSKDLNQEQMTISPNHLSYKNY